MKQQPLDLFNNDASPSLVLGNSNQIAWQYLNQTGWLSPICWLYGEAGAGKTTLLKNWQNNVQANHIDLFSLDFTQPLVAGHYIIDGVPTLDFLHQPLFHLINAVQHAGAKLVLSANITPANYPTKLADLASRLRSANFLHLLNPDDLMLKAVMSEHLRLKQLKIDDMVIDYLLKRIPRNFSDALSIVNMLDEYSLNNNMEININLARMVIDSIA
jgi:chromosomal replication initiation ATPase DnaA